MRHGLLALTIVLFAGLATSCSSTDEPPGSGSAEPDAAAAELDRAKTETREAAQAMQDYAYAQKAEFVGQMKRELTEIQEELDRLSATYDRSSGAAKVDARDKIETVRERWTDAKKRLDEAESATDSNWNDVMGAFKRSYGELTESLDKTRQWLSDKIEP
jgi:hypothetical protein